ncbi:MAG TPA: hypothetical protein VF017_21705 [Thermoanaerobaculia bacterium]|nr:hypothetical protein [Thermoanaerobaculia bacterium]
MTLMASLVATSASAFPFCNPRFCTGSCSAKCELLDGTKTTCGAQYPDLCVSASSSVELTLEDQVAAGPEQSSGAPALGVLAMAEAATLTCGN